MVYPFLLVLPVTGHLITGHWFQRHTGVLEGTPSSEAALGDAHIERKRNHLGSDIADAVF
jgi:hypothetical protein